MIHMYKVEKTTSLILDLKQLMRKPALGVLDQVRHTPYCTTTEDGYKLEISDLGNRFCFFRLYVPVNNFSVILGWLHGFTGTKKSG